MHEKAIMSRVFFICRESNEPNELLKSNDKTIAIDRVKILYLSCVRFILVILEGSKDRSGFIRVTLEGSKDQSDHESSLYSGIISFLKLFHL